MCIYVSGGLLAGEQTDIVEPGRMHYRNFIASLVSVTNNKKQNYLLCVRLALTETFAGETSPFSKKFYP